MPRSTNIASSSVIEQTIENRHRPQNPEDAAIKTEMRTLTGVARSLQTTSSSCVSSAQSYVDAVLTSFTHSRVLCSPCTLPRLKHEYGLRASSRSTAWTRPHHRVLAFHLHRCRVHPEERLLALATSPQQVGGTQRHSPRPRFP